MDVTQPIRLDQLTIELQRAGLECAGLGLQMDPTPQILYVIDLDGTFSDIPPEFQSIVQQHQPVYLGRQYVRDRMRSIVGTRLDALTPDDLQSVALALTYALGGVDDTTQQIRPLDEWMARDASA